MRAYFDAVTAHFGRWFRPPTARKDHWQVDERLLHGQLVKRSDLHDQLAYDGFRRLIQTGFIERVNLSIRQGVSLLTRRTWSLAQTDQHLLNHVEWWRCNYRPHETLREPLSDRPRQWRQRTPAMALGLGDHIWTVEEVLHPWFSGADRIRPQRPWGRRW